MENGKTEIEFCLRLRCKLLARSILNRPPEDPISCLHCRFVASGYRTLSSHIKKQHDLFYPSECKSCGLGFLGSLELATHFKSEHADQ